MDVNEGGEANKPINIEDGGDDEDMIDDYWMLAKVINNLHIKVLNIF